MSNGNGNGTDTDVVSPSDESEPLAGERIGGEYPALSGQPPPESPAGNVLGAPSMQDVSSATPMASPLGGQQPGQLPAMIAQGAAAQGTPVGATVHQRHGGLLTGLVGVLLDGLAAGVMTPQSGQGFSQAAQMGYQMPMMRQQQRQQIEQFKTQQELNKAQVAMAHVQTLQAYALANRYSDEERAQMTDEDVKQHEEWQRQDLVDLIATASTRDEAAQTLNQMRIQDPDQGHHLWMWPTGHDGQGNDTTWGIYRMDPDKKLDHDQPYLVPSRDKDGNFQFETKMLNKGAPVQAANFVRTKEFLEAEMKAAPKPLTALQEMQKAKYGMNPVLVQDPSGRGKQRLMSLEDAQTRGLTQGAIAQSSTQVSNVEASIAQMNTVQDAVTTYREWMNEVYREGGITGTQRAAIDMLMPKSLGINVAQLGPMSFSLNVPELLARPAQAAALASLPRAQQEAVWGYWNMLNAVPMAQKAMIQQGRTNTEVMNIEMRTVPDMLPDATNFNIGLNDYQNRLSIMDKKNPSVEGKDTIEDQQTKTEERVRKQIETAKRGELPPGTPLAGGGTAGDPAPKTAGGKSPDKLRKEGWTWKAGSQGWGWYK